MIRPIFIYTIILFLMFYVNYNAFAGTDQTSKYNLEDLIAIRTDKIKDAMNDNIAKIMTLHQEIDANPSAFLVLTHVNKDASKVLNYRLTWLNSDTDMNNKEALTKYFLSRKGTASADSLNLPEDLNTKIKASVFDANFKASDFNLKSLDFKWITELQQFDYWSLEDNSPIAFLEKYDFTNYPSPDFSPMIGWAKLRLIKGIQDNNIGQAIDETLHLGRLLHSTETLSGALSGIMIQEQVVKFAQTQHKPLRFDATILNKAKIYFKALGNALSIPFIDARTYLKLLQINSGPGFCAAINTAAPTLLLYRASLESDLQPLYNSFTNLMTLTLPCRWKIIHSAWGGDLRYPKQFTNLASLGIKGRKKETDAIKASLTPEEYQKLQHEIPNPRWPQYYVYMLALKINIEQLFTELNSK